MHGGAWRRSQRRWFAGWQEKGGDRGRWQSHNRQERRQTYIFPKWKTCHESCPEPNFQEMCWKRESFQTFLGQASKIFRFLVASETFQPKYLPEVLPSPPQLCSTEPSKLFSLFPVARRKKEIWYRFISSSFLLLHQWFGKFNHQAARSAPSQSSFCAARHVGHCAPSPSQPSRRDLWKSFSLATFLLECLKHFFFVSAWLSSFTTMHFFFVICLDPAWCRLKFNGISWQIF